MSTSKGTKRDIFWRITIAYICVMLFGVAILWRVFQLQNVEGNYWRAMSDSLTTKYFTVEAERGNIYSADGRLMATSLPVFEVRMDLRAEGLTDERFYKNVKALGASLAQLFGDKSAIEYTNGLINARKNRSRYHLIRNNVSYTQMLKLKKFPLFELGQHKGGVIIIQKNKRLYPYNVLAKRTIGYVRENDVQPVGLEGQFNEHLTGDPGKRLMQKVSGGNWIPLNDENEIESRNGRDVYTTIDVSLQDIAENALLKTLTKNNADHGCAVVMEVATGKIRAMANLGKTTDGSYGETFNYAVGEAHEPGSTFKLASMLALLEDGYINIEDHVNVEYGRKQFFNQTMRDAEQHNFTDITIKKAFAHSSNVGVSKLVTQCYSKNPEAYLAHLRKLQLDQKTGIEIPGEGKQYIKNTKDKFWSSRVSLPWMSVGYETNVSPLRMLTLYAAVANNGVMMKPYIVEAVKEYGKPVKEYEPQIAVGKICSEKTLASLRTLLEEVVIDGTAKNLLNPHYSVAGKTGTAQIADAKYGYGKRVYQSSFMGYFPANNPMYAIAVVINNPTNGVYYGSAVAGPVFKEIADNVYATMLDMHPTEYAANTRRMKAPVVRAGMTDDINTIVTELNLPATVDGESVWTSIAVADSTMVAQPRTVELAKGVPNVVGLGLKDALYVLESKGLQVTASGYGSVLSQSIKPGQEFREGQIITLNLGM